MLKMRNLNRGSADTSVFYPGGISFCFFFIGFLPISCHEIAKSLKKFEPKWFLFIPQNELSFKVKASTILVLVAGCGKLYLLVGCLL